METGSPKTYRVLCIDGGGMRGVYSAAYLDALLRNFARRRSISSIDLGKAFDLIAGTSTGGILACALAKGVPMAKVVSLYRDRGPGIFPEKVPSTFFGLAFQYPKRRRLVAQGAVALEAALRHELGDETLGELWQRRGIALAIPAVQMGNHHSWVFKTPHRTELHRDDGYRLVDVCLATSAAPIFRSLAWIKNPDSQGGTVFADGGLWANTPVLVGLVEALELTQPGDCVELFCLGTCPPPSGDDIPKTEVNRGFLEWRFGADVSAVSISAQQYAYDNMARMLLKHASRPKSRVVRFPHGEVPSHLLNHLALDETSPVAMDALIRQANQDVSQTLSVARDTESMDGVLLHTLLMGAPALAG